MKAMQINEVSDLDTDKEPLSLVDMPVPEPSDRELLIQVSVCGVCHTELDEIEGRTPPDHYPMVPGHQVVGRVTAIGSAVKRFSQG